MVFDVTLPDHLAQYVAKVAEDMGISKSAVIRLAVRDSYREWLKRIEEEESK